MPQELIVGLDIGTTKICAVVGEVRENQVEIVGLGCAPTAGGLRKGVVVNIENTVRAIRKAVEEAQVMADCEIRSVYASVGGGQTKVINSQGIIAIKDREVTPADMDRVIDTARTVAIPSDREVIHTLVQDFLIDGQDGIKDPVGIHGVRLECKVHIVTGAVTSLNNIIKCCNRANLEVTGIALKSLAAGEAVLTEEEKELGWPSSISAAAPPICPSSPRMPCGRTSSCRWGATTSPTTSPWASPPPSIMPRG